MLPVEPMGWDARSAVYRPPPVLTGSGPLGPPLTVGLVRGQAWAHRVVQTVVLICLLVSGCGFQGKNQDPSFWVVNNTTHPVKVVYLATADRQTPPTSPRLGKQSFELQVDETDNFLPFPTGEPYCTKAAIVAYRLDTGDELVRLDPPVCYGNGYTWYLAGKR